MILYSERSQEITGIGLAPWIGSLHTVAYWRVHFKSHVVTLVFVTSTGWAVSAGELRHSEMSDCTHTFAVIEEVEHAMHA